MIEFMQAYWREILLVLVLLVEVVMFFLKKKPQVNLVDHITSLLDDYLPSLIQLAEQTSTDGQSKLNIVRAAALKKISKYVTKSDLEYWNGVITSKVEAILSCPQKKGNI